MDLDGVGPQRVDVHGGGRERDPRRAVRESLGVSLVGVVECGLSDGADVLDAAVEDVGGREEGERGVVVLLVVPAEEVLQVAACMELGLESSGVVGLVLERLELCLAEGVVVRERAAG